MFGNKDVFDEPNIEKDRKRKNIIFTVTFGVLAFIILNLILYLATKI